MPRIETQHISFPHFSLVMQQTINTISASFDALQTSTAKSTIKSLFIFNHVKQAIQTASAASLAMLIIKRCPSARHNLHFQKEQSASWISVLPNSAK